MLQLSSTEDPGEPVRGLAFHSAVIAAPNRLRALEMVVPSLPATSSTSRMPAEGLRQALSWTVGLRFSGRPIARPSHWQKLARPRIRA
ncbi:MAG: hypothetical protein QM756_42315 [Polyangiaceae bacterium]